MRIVQVNSFAGKVGGAEIYCHGLIDELRARGHDVAFFAGDPERSERSDRTCIVQRPEFDAARLVHDPELEGTFTEFAGGFRPDLIHLHNVHHFPVGFLGAAARLGVPVMMTAHDFGYLCPNSWMTWGDGTVCSGGPGRKCFEHGCEANYPFDGRIVTAWKLRYEALKRNLRAFACPSQFLAEQLAAHGFPRAIGVPLWTDGGDDSARSAADLPPRDSNRVLFLGRLVREKGVETLVRAWPLVLAARPDAVLSVVGGGPELEPLKTLASELGLDADGIFLGRVPHEQVGEHLGRATCQVLPSWWCENSPVTTYESYLSGLPMIASDIAGLPEMVRPGETGLLARPRDERDLAAKILELLGDGALQRRIQQGCLDSVARFTKERHMASLLELYDQVLADGPVTCPDGLDDLLAPADAFLRRFDEVERWALEMQKHIQWLESQR
ncbi:glycosyltransferase [Engelhardtia mirabilis]|uniref:GDP-mannose-dependent alpha-(1-6)-phosphatidylinositol monomannoside mannosyltransferase n=1 Tax=Engelhardtia mirabilis TaxID=2528011 RepID=A0A518BIN9_9BACT|nr:GDP-mannose-dependent alpha-(1-6)-phosphatidylinositol monomannoside mannosyltransferase [Planctomycetes bacterium Pla133]QDV01175.1 GDP-mannose-dependent alpha-(1-6)-phosphatidylinositol monomannoside mannosyltransferase [Planctomycetes bacterium Pla86]